MTKIVFLKTKYCKKDHHEDGPQTITIDGKAIYCTTKAKSFGFDSICWNHIPGRDKLRAAIKKEFKSPIGIKEFEEFFIKKFPQYKHLIKAV